MSPTVEPSAAEEMVAGVRAAGLKLTPQRLAIIQELAGDPSHPTAQELYDRLQPTLPTMSFATVYNTLSALASAGLCAARTLTRGSTRFDPNTAAHDHAVCDGCGLVMDVSRASDRSAAATEAVDDALHPFAVRAVERIYRGQCGACQARAEDEHSAVAVAAAGSTNPSA